MGKTIRENWNKDSSEIFERFAAGIDEAIGNGEELKCADRDLQYGIRLQNQRIGKLGLNFYYELTPRGYFTDGLNLGNRWCDGHYVNSLEVRGCERVQSIYQGDRKLFKKKEKVKLYQTVTDVRSGQDVSEDEYICPDCGAATKIGLLTQGCPYCGNRFRMDELYPKISNYYFYPDVGGTRTELAKLAIPSILIAIVLIYLPFCAFGLLGIAFNSIGFAIGSNSYQTMQSMGNFIGILIWGIFVALFFGVIGGWVFTSFVYLFRLGSFAAQRIPMAKYLGCQKQFEEFIKKSSPEFSYEFFAGKTVNMIKMLIFSENPEELPFYNGRALNPAFRNIVDVTSMGAVGITKMEFQNGYAVIYADVYLEDTYYRDGKVKRVNEVMTVIMRKNIERPVDMRFKITSIHCPTCAGSFDATKNKFCPYCGNPYRMEDLDWSVEYLDYLQK